MADIVRSHAAERGGSPAITYEGRTQTWGDLHERTNRVAKGLEALGVGSQDRIGFIDKNCPEYFEVFFGAGKINAVTVAVNWRLAPGEMAYIINDAEAKVLFVGPEFLPHLDKIQGDLTTVQHVVVLGDDAARTTYEPWMAAQSGDDPGVAATGDDVCFQLYTSGTTGLPKGVMLTNDNLFAMLPHVADMWDVGPDDVNLVAMPLFHIGGSGWAVAGMLRGGHAILLREVDPAQILQAIPQYSVTHAFLVPAVLQFLLMMPSVHDADFSCLRMIAYGAAPITDQVLKDCLATFGCDFVQLYGLTETTGAITQLDAGDHDPENRPELLRSCGKPFPWVEFRIVDQATGEDRAEGEVGELWARSGQNMKGYWKQPEETAKTITDDGWLKTGDAGYLQDGYVYLHDRVKDMIVSGGENIYPAEIENALMSHPDVADVAVIGVPDDRWGETVKAIVVRTEGSDVTDAQLIAFCREHLAHFKCPTSVDFTDVLPRNPSGKLLKRELRAPFWQGRERMVN
jgi:long-chain acyl-CoA synthetase